MFNAEDYKMDFDAPETDEENPPILKSRPPIPTYTLHEEFLMTVRRVNETFKHIYAYTVESQEHYNEFVDAVDKSMKDFETEMKRDLYPQLKQVATDMMSSGELIVNEYTVSVKDFGAVGDGNTDDRQAFQNAIDSGASTILIPDGDYYISAPIIINRPNVQLMGVGGGLKYNVARLICDGDGIHIVGNSRFTTICGFTLLSKYGYYSNNTGIAFVRENDTDVTNTKVRIENMHIYSFCYGISNTRSQYGNLNKPITLWNCEFLNIHFYGDDLMCSTCMEISNTTETHGANFGLTFKNVFFGHGMVFIKNSKGTFEGCNFGIKNVTTIHFASSYLTFTGCNFECDEHLSSGDKIILGNMSYEFDNCQFIAKGYKEDIALFKIESSAQIIEFKNIYATKDTMRFFPVGAFGGLTRANGVRFRGYIPSSFIPDDADIYSAYKSTYTRSDGAIPDVADSTVSNIANIRNSPYWSTDRKQIEIYKDDQKLDAFGNKTGLAQTDKRSIGGGLKVQFGTATLNNSVYEYAIPETAGKTNIIVFASFSDGTPGVLTPMYSQAGCTLSISTVYGSSGLLNSGVYNSTAIIQYVIIEY